MAASSTTAATSMAPATAAEGTTTTMEAASSTATVEATTGTMEATRAETAGTAEGTSAEAGTERGSGPMVATVTTKGRVVAERAAVLKCGRIGCARAIEQWSPHLP